MSGFTFRPAKREMIRLLVGVSGGTGSGKSWSSMELASGIAGDARFAVIDTENGRARLYADHFKFDVTDLEAPFTPERYMEAIRDAVKAGYSTIVVDQFSQEWEGDGGVLDDHEAILDKMCGNDYAKREACNMVAWAKAKAPHKAMMQDLIQTKANVIICLRADDKVEMAKENGKTVIRPKQTLIGKDGWVPICEKRFPFELTLSFLLTADAPGVPKPIKNLAPEFRDFFPLNKPMSKESGAKLAEWARGASAVPLPAQTPSARAEDVPSGFTPLCNPCSKEAKNEVFMVFVPAGKTPQGREYEAFWQCPKKIKEHGAEKHAEWVAKVAEVQRKAETI